VQTKLLIIVLIGSAAIGGLIVASTLDSIFAGQGSKKTKNCFDLSDATKKECKQLLRECIDDPSIFNPNLSTKKDCKAASRNHP
jgi:hypothetical protein